MFIIPVKSPYAEDLVMKFFRCFKERLRWALVSKFLRSNEIKTILQRSMTEFVRSKKYRIAPSRS